MGNTLCEFLTFAGGAIACAFHVNQKNHPLCHVIVLKTRCTEGIVFCNIYFPAKFIFLLFPDLYLLHTTPCPINFLLSIQAVSPDTEIIGLFLF